MNIKRTSDYASLAAAISAIGAQDAELIVDKAEALGGNVTIPANVHCLFVKGGCINTTGYTLTFNTAPEVGLYQVFEGTGAVVFNTPVNVHPRWYGAKEDGINDDAVPIAQAIDSVSGKSGDVIYAVNNVTIQHSEIYKFKPIDAGGYQSADINVKGCVAGDPVVMSYPMTFKDGTVDGMLISAFIKADNTARVTIYNANKDAVELDEGLITLKIFKFNRPPAMTATSIKEAEPIALEP